MPQPHIHRIGGIPANAIGQAADDFTGVHAYRCNGCGEEIRVLVLPVTVTTIA